ncbi:MAG TPA: hypothetical protein VG499_01580 [Actinomycetota bacterium]|nr:hypothetical protein [Actinomycetota bacterium]
MELPDAPFYRRWSVLLAGIIGLAAIAALLGWRGLQQVATPATTTTTPPTSVVPTTTVPPTSLEPTSKPDRVLWRHQGTGVVRSRGFRAPDAWRIEWEYDCSNFKEFGTGGFKITGRGALDQVDIQATTLEGSGRRTFPRGGFGHLLVESVCDRWSVTVLSG